MAVELKLLSLAVACVLAVGANGWGSNTGVELMKMQMEEVERVMEMVPLPMLAKEKGLNTLVKLVTSAGLAGALSGAGPFTVFGPTDPAFAAIPEWLKKALMKNETLLADVLKYHVLSGKVMSSDIKDELQVPTLLGPPIRLNIYKNKVVTAQCSPIDLNNVDLEASNGVLHFLKRVMIPPAGDVIDAAVACPAFKTLVTAVKAAGLVDTLKGKGPFTVFAPTDAAFKKIDPATLDNILKNKTLLTSILEYHVVPLTYCSPGLVGYNTLKTLNGANITIALDGNKVKINDATVVRGGADGSVTNGVVHAIDTVLLPGTFGYYRP